MTTPFQLLAHNRQRSLFTAELRQRTGLCLIFGVLACTRTTADFDSGGQLGKAEVARGTWSATGTEQFAAPASGATSPTIESVGSHDGMQEPMHRGGADSGPNNTSALVGAVGQRAAATLGSDGSGGSLVFSRVSAAGCEPAGDSGAIESSGGNIATGGAASNSGRVATGGTSSSDGQMATAGVLTNGGQAVAGGVANSGESGASSTAGFGFGGGTATDTGGIGGNVAAAGQSNALIKPIFASLTYFDTDLRPVEVSATTAIPLGRCNSDENCLRYHVALSSPKHHQMRVTFHLGGKRPAGEECYYYDLDGPTRNWFHVHPEGRLFWGESPVDGTPTTTCYEQIDLTDDPNGYWTYHDRTNQTYPQAFMAYGYKENGIRKFVWVYTVRMPE